MKKLTITSAAVALITAGMTMGAVANDLEAKCVEYVSSNGGDTSGCGCLAESADDAMTAELLGVESDADLEGLSDASKEALAACFPE